MSQGDTKPVPDWQIAARDATEKDPSKVLGLSEELIRALDGESNRLLDRVIAESKMRDYGHRKIQQDQVAAQQLRDLNRFQTILRISAHFEVFLRLKQGTKRLTSSRVVRY